MNEIDIRNEYLEHYKRENDAFDMANFILNNEIVVDNGAIILITPNQVVITRNNPKEGGKIGSGSHDDTYDILNKVLYDLPFNKRIIKTESKELEEEFEKEFQIKNKQNILIRMINEGKSVIHMRGIYVELPSTITESQLEFLIYLEEQYGIIFKFMSNEMVKDGETPLICFKDKARKDVFCNSFEPLIEYARKNLVDKEKDVIVESHLIGTTLNDILIKVDRKEDNMPGKDDNTLALAMTNTWFSMLPNTFKEKYIHNFDLYSKAFIDVYNKSIDSIRKQQEESLPYFTRGGSLDGRIK